jgi:hypothetical protein
VTVIGVDFGAATLAEADQVLSRLPVPEEAISCTHLIRRGTPHVACSLQLPITHVDAVLDVLVEQTDVHALGIVGAGRETGPRDLVAGAAIAAGQHAARAGGRAVIYPGVHRLTGNVTALSLVAMSEINRIIVLPERTSPAPETVVATRDHVRPEWTEGLLTLVTTPSGADCVTPFELPDPTPCCGDELANRKAGATGSRLPGMRP